MTGTTQLSFNSGGAGFGGKTVAGQEFDVSFSDILDNLDLGLMGTFEARNGPWSIIGDAIYPSISEYKDADVGPGIPVSVDADIDGLVLSAALGYDLIDTSQYRLNAFDGLCDLDFDTTVSVEVGSGSRRLNDDFCNWDAVGGVRGNYAVSDQWGIAYFGDIGTGDTGLTWQVGLALEYNFENWTLSGGYSHLDWEGVGDSKTIEDIDFSDPFLGAKFRF